MSSVLGQCFRVMTFGESHSGAVGTVIDGLPGGMAVDLDAVQQQLQRRKPGQSSITTGRKEEDQVVCLSGLQEGLTLGSPLTLLVYNKDARPEDYQHLQNLYRPSHSDYSYEKKYGILAHSGGGRSSARETLARVAAGAVAEQLLRHIWRDFHIIAYTHRVASLSLEETPNPCFSRLEVDRSPVRCPHTQVSREMEQLIKEAREQGDSLGGEIRCAIHGVPAGLGEPVFHKLEADLAQAMMSIPASRYFIMGDGLQSTTKRGSQNKDRLQRLADGSVGYTSNFCGGIEGGISNGNAILFSVGFKPPSTIAQKEETLTRDLQPTTYQSSPKRHDPCVLPRAAVVVEGMACLILADHLMRQQSQNTLRPLAKLEGLQ